MNSRINESRSKKVVLQDPLLQQNRKETQPQQEAMITLKLVHKKPALQQHDNETQPQQDTKIKPNANDNIPGRNDITIVKPGRTSKKKIEEKTTVVTVAAMRIHDTGSIAIIEYKHNRIELLVRHLKDL